jgi:dTMP kinase
MEGIEGSGKSTQIKMLRERLEFVGFDVTASKEPGGTTLGKGLRAILLEPHASGERWCPEAELLMFYADRAQHLANLIRPAMAEGRVVIVDRFEDSTRAYQGASGVSEYALQRLREVVLGDFRPDLTILLDVDPVISLRRVYERNAAAKGFVETRFDDEGMAFHSKVRERFLRIAELEPERVRIVPADGDPAAIAEAVWRHVKGTLERTHFRS